MSHPNRMSGYPLGNQVTPEDYKIQQAFDELVVSAHILGTAKRAGETSLKLADQERHEGKLLSNIQFLIAQKFDIVITEAGDDTISTQRLISIHRPPGWEPYLHDSDDNEVSVTTLCEAVAQGGELSIELRETLE